MSKKLTIIVDNIPDDDWKHYWEGAVEAAPKDLGFHVDPTDKIEFDFRNMLSLAPESMIEMLASAVTLHAVETFDKKYNQ